MPIRSDVTRRDLIIGALGGSALLALPQGAMALDVAGARKLVNSVVTDINRIINSGEPEGQMIKDFEKVFSTYADVPIIARSSLGIAARSATKAQLAAYTQAFRGYIARKYGRRFREFIGGKITVLDARKINGFYEVISTAQLRGRSPFDLRWLVSNKSGSDRFFNLIIQGVNMVATERQEIGAMLDSVHGNIDALTQKLKTAG